jgi:hypothetical protein
VPEQIVWLVSKLLNAGVGYTVMVSNSGKPKHELAVGVTVIVDVTVLIPEFSAVNEAIEPLPLDDKPIDGKLFVQL